MEAHCSGQTANRRVVLLLCMLVWARMVDAGRNPALQHRGNLESPVANLVGLQHLPRHIEAATELVKQFQLPDKLPLHPFGFVGTDPLKLSEGAETRAAAEAFCDGRVGHQFLQAWNATEQHFCKSESSSSSSSRSSSRSSSDIRCYIAPEHVFHRPLTACIATNLVLANSTAFMGKHTAEEFSTPPTDVLMPTFVSKLPRPEPASIKLACKAADVNKTAHIVPDISVNGQTGYVMVDHVAQWLVPGIQDRQYEAVQQACSSTGANVVEHPVMFVSRIGTTNIFHALEDLLVALAFLAAHNTPVADGKLQVVFTDQDPPYPFTLADLWRHVSTAGPVRYLLSEPFPANTCFRKAIIVPIGFTSSLMSIATDRQLLCRSSLAIGLSSWLREVSGQVTPARHPPTTFATKAPTLSHPCSQPFNGTVERLKILFLARHKWYKPTDSTHNITVYENWQLVRDLYNEEELIDTVKATAHAWNKGVCAYQQAATGHQQPGCRHAHATFDVAVHEHHHHHRLPRQLEDSTASSIIVGVHGAGLTHALFMPPGGAVLEIMPRPGNSHYLSISNMMGHGYARSDYHIHERRANATDVRAKLLQLMGRLGGCRDAGTAVGEDA